MPPSLAKIISKHYLPHLENQLQWSVNDYWSCVPGNHTPDRLQAVIKEWKDAFLGNTDCDTLPAPSWKWASTEPQWLLFVYLRYYGVRQVANSHKRSIGCLYRQKGQWNAPCPIVEMWGNGMSMIFVLSSWLITGWCGRWGIYTSFWLLLYAKRLKNT